MDATKIPTNVGSIGIFDSGYGGLTILEQENADQFGVQRENYALMGFSSGGHIVGLIGSDNEKFGYKAFGLPQPAALLLGYPINDFFEVTHFSPI